MVNVPKHMSWNIIVRIIPISLPLRSWNNAILRDAFSNLDAGFFSHYDQIVVKLPHAFLRNGKEIELNLSLQQYCLRF